MRRYASYTAHDDVNDRDSFVAYLGELRRQLADGAEWENADLPAFLEAMQAWATDWPHPAHTNPWRHAADVIAAATLYE
ncbi:hypothetical protein [Phenylobacterium sp. CCH9-H3]|uniref:DUF7660 family protein n=1 Tax=Phenylobacterium sp. CCH9-H3 TaxID=1768774 RepID=UPI000AF199DE|nr:hypothetical protein [Phenylobacterium sp. CCH9-H3]